MTVVGLVFPEGPLESFFFYPLIYFFSATSLLTSLMFTRVLLPRSTKLNGWSSSYT
jgi:hypothetical protein